MPRLVGINHLAVEVGDLNEAIAFFEGIFDDVQLRGRAGNMAFVDMGDQFVALESVAHPSGVGHIGLVVDDRDIQFTKTPRVLDGMGFGELEKSERALAELRAKGLAD